MPHVALEPAVALTGIVRMVFFFNDPATAEIDALPLHDALPISSRRRSDPASRAGHGASAIPPAGSTPRTRRGRRSEEHTSELQSPCNLVCRLLLEKNKQELREIHADPRLDYAVANPGMTDTQGT